MSTIKDDLTPMCPLCPEIEREMGQLSEVPEELFPQRLPLLVVYTYYSTHASQDFRQYTQEKSASVANESDTARPDSWTTIKTYPVFHQLPN